MTLIKTSFLTAIATIVRVTSNFIINKVMAMYVGPTGLAIVGQLVDFVGIVTALSNGATTQGITKYIAEYNDIDKKKKIISTSLILSIVFSFFISIFLYFFDDLLSIKILKTQEYSSVFSLFSITLIFLSLNITLMAVINGQKEILKYILINICSSIITLLFTSILIIKLGLIGALYALVLNQSIVFFVTLFFIVKSNWFKFIYFKNGIDTESIRKLSKFSLMALISLMTVPISHLYIRNYIGENLSWNDAGYWQGIWYISSMYLMVITTSLSVYYLPRISEITDTKELRNEIFYGYKIIIPISILLALLIFLLKDYVILIAFSKDFTPMIELFKWQLIGDVIKMASWLLGYITLAKAMTKTFIFLEVFGSLSFVLLSIYLIDYYGLVGITYAFCINYLIYFIILIIIFRKELFYDK